MDLLDQIWTKLLYYLNYLQNKKSFDCENTRRQFTSNDLNSFWVFRLLSSTSNHRFTSKSSLGMWQPRRPILTASSCWRSSGSKDYHEFANIYGHYRS